MLTNYKDFPKDLIPPLTSRIKIMASADIAEKRRHQDGRILFDCKGLAFDIRLSTYVTMYGETIVMRLLRSRSQLLEIRDIGMSPRMLQRFLEDVLDTPSGVGMVTGPTGSGKTTTLYASINYLNDPKTSIITAEDPVEYVIEGISQCSINPRINLTYEDTLKSIVRQDPDHHQKTCDPRDTIMAIIRLADVAVRKFGLGLRPDPSIMLVNSPEAAYLGADEIMLAELEVMIEDCALSPGGSP